MNKVFSSSAVALVAIVGNSLSATLSVLPGTSIQAKIDQAQPGDIVAIFGGTYNEDITINKAIRLVEVSGQEVILNGNVTFSGVSDAPPFEGFTQGSSGRGITINNTTGLVLSNIDARPGSGINVTGTSNVRIVNSRSSSISTSAAMLELLDVTTIGSLGQTAGTMHVFRSTIGENIETSTGAQKTVAFRTTVSGDNNWRSKRAWFGYCNTRSFNFYDQTAAKVVVVGCIIDRKNVEADGVKLFGWGGENSFVVVNNVIKNVGWSWGGDQENAIDCRGANNTYFIANNYLQLKYLGGSGAWGAGVFITDSTKATIINNIIVGAWYPMNVGFGASVKNNLYFDLHNNSEQGGVIAQGSIVADPQFVANQAPTLAADSPCINAGVEDPIYNNRDGSRNTIGPSGGTLYDPDARTTENPVVISFDLGPEQVLEGEATEILLSNGQAVSQP